MASPLATRRSAFTSPGLSAARGFRLIARDPVAAVERVPPFARNRLLPLPIGADPLLVPDEVRSPLGLCRIRTGRASGRACLSHSGKDPAGQLPGVELRTGFDHDGAGALHRGSDLDWRRRVLHSRFLSHSRSLPPQPRPGQGVAGTNLPLRKVADALRSEAMRWVLDRSTSTLTQIAISIGRQS